MTQHKSKNGNNLLGNSFQFVSGEADLVVMGGEGTDRSSLAAGGMLEIAGGQTGKQGSWRALQVEPGCEDGWGRATLVSPCLGL